MHILINFQPQVGPQWLCRHHVIKKVQLVRLGTQLVKPVLVHYHTINLSDRVNRIEQNGTVFITQETTYVTLACDGEKQTKASKCKEGQIVQQNGFLISVC